MFVKLGRQARRAQKDPKHPPRLTSILFIAAGKAYHVLNG